MKSYVLGLDLGTSAVKLCLTDELGNAVAQTEGGYPTETDATGRAEQDTALWLGAIYSAAARLKSAFPAEYERVEAIGLSAQMPTLVVTDKEGRALFNAVTWQDARADNIGARMLELWGSERHFRITGVRLDGRYIVPMYAYLRENGLSRRDVMLLSAKDYLYGVLTGAAATEPTTASGYGVFDLKNNCWDYGLCAGVSVTADMLPEVYACTDAPGGLSASAAAILGLRAGIPVALGCADSICGAVAMGAIEPGDVAAIWGTSTALLAVTDGVNSDAAGCFITPMYKCGLYALEADMLSTGLSTAWLSRLLSVSPEELMQMAQGAPAGCKGLRFYPYLMGGEQSVLWDATLTGSIRGLRCEHDSAYLARALLEGMCFETRRCMDAFRRAGAAGKQIVCSGHISESPFFMQMLANVSGTVCRASALSRGSACGAAYMAGLYAGLTNMERSLEDCALYTPESAGEREYADYYGLYIK